MFVRKRKNASGSISIQIIDKSSGKFSVVEHLGTSSDLNEINYLYNLAKDKIISIQNQLTLFPSHESSRIKSWLNRFMDTLDDDMERTITDHTFNFVKNILGKTINIIFFDATTLHFETFKADRFRKTGFSKVGKHNQPQIVIGLMVTEEGLPIGYDVYPGNEFDGHTIRSALKRVSRRYNKIEKQIWFFR